MVWPCVSFSTICKADVHHQATASSQPQLSPIRAAWTYVLRSDHLQQERNQAPQQLQQQKEAAAPQGARQEAALQQGGPQGGHQFDSLQMEKMVKLERVVSALQRELGASRQREEKAEVVPLPRLTSS